MTATKNFRRGVRTASGDTGGGSLLSSSSGDTGLGNGMPVASRPRPVSASLGNGCGGERLVMYRLPPTLAREVEAERWSW